MDRDRELSDHPERRGIDADERTRRVEPPHRAAEEGEVAAQITDLRVACRRPLPVPRQVRVAAVPSQPQVVGDREQRRRARATIDRGDLLVRVRVDARDRLAAVQHRPDRIGGRGKAVRLRAGERDHCPDAGRKLRRRALRGRRGRGRRGSGGHGRRRGRFRGRRGRAAGRRRPAACCQRNRNDQRDRQTNGTPPPTQHGAQRYAPRGRAGWRPRAGRGGPKGQFFLNGSSRIGYLPNVLGGRIVRIG